MITEQKSYNIPEQVKLMDYIEKNKKNYNLILRLMEINSDKKFIINLEEYWFDRKKFLIVCLRTWWFYEDNKDWTFTVWYISWFYFLMFYKLYELVNEEIFIKIAKTLKQQEHIKELYFSACLFEKIDLVLVYYNWNVEIITNTLFNLLFNSWWYNSWFIAFRFNDIALNENIKNHIWSFIDKVYDPNYSEIKIKKKKWEAYMIEWNLDFDSSNTKYVDLEQKFAHAEITSKIYKNKTKTYKVKELTKLNNDDE